MEALWSCNSEHAYQRGFHSEIKKREIGIWKRKEEASNVKILSKPSTIIICTVRSSTNKSRRWKMRDDIKGCLLGSAPPPRLISCLLSTPPVVLYLVCYYAAYDAMRSIEDSRYDDYVSYTEKSILTVS